MTGAQDSDAATRPISVAELLAKNGTVGSPMAGGGRRRRRRGSSDAVTVAELTGQIPIVGDSYRSAIDMGDAGLDDDVGPPYGGGGQPDGGAVTDGGGVGCEAIDDPPPPVVANPVSTFFREGTGAELMSPDPVDDSLVVNYPSDDTASYAIADYAEPVASHVLGTQDAVFAQSAGASDPIPEDVSGDRVEAVEALDDAGDADEAFDDDHDVHDHGVFADADADDYAQAPSRGRLILRGLVMTVESLAAVAFGAGLFLGFGQLWQWNSLVAMVLAVLATLALVAGVRAIRRTEDITSTLFAVGVGLLVTFGPLALMHAN